MAAQEETPQGALLREHRQSREPDHDTCESGIDAQGRGVSSRAEPSAQV